ncbi:BT4734/BF3469 family protein [uncultured Pontibacter sp.]|uniref:BT4734/BF3469 family protein n=1 Tax=uncultured Pontibacter sp. TaxID=453356 RepID=UPI002601A6CD|nr:BT4734/BF3469 family protein [uncultured Pontibacter sp.]
MNTTIQSYKKVIGTAIPTDTTLTDYIDLVKNGYEVEQILKARAAGKGSDAYKSVKNNRKCFTMNFTFNGKKEKANLRSATGLLFFDIDTDGFDIAILDKSKVLMLHNSFGGKGWSIFVRVDGLTEQNLKSTVSNIADKLGLSDYIDKNAVKSTQYTICSYDPELYFNEAAPVFAATEDVVEIKKDNKVKKDKEEEDIKKKHIDTERPLFTPLRLSNATDYIDEGKDYTLFPDKVGTVKIVLKKSVKKGEQNNYIFYNALKIVYLNPNHSEEQIKVWLCNIAESAGIKNYLKSVKNALKTAMKYKAEGTLEVQCNHSRKIIFNPNNGWCGETRRSVAASKLNELRGDETAQKIYDCIEDWGSTEKITAKAIAERIGKSEKTVKRHYSKFKEYIGELNKAMKTEKTVAVTKPVLKKIEVESGVITELPIIREKEDLLAGALSIDMSELFAA